MRIVIAYDQSGRIVNVAKVYHLPDYILHPFADLMPEHHFLSIEDPEGELREMTLLDIQHEFSVSVADEKLEQRKKS